MSNPAPDTTTGQAPEPPAQTHAQAAILLRRPFAPGAIGFRAMTKVALDGRPGAGATVAAYLNAQSVVQRLNTVVPGCWRQEFHPIPALAESANARRLYLTCRLTITLPVTTGGPSVDAVYEDIGELDSASFAGLKALYSDARKRAAVAAGIGAYLYTALAPLILPIGNQPRQVALIRRPGKSDLLTLTPDTEQWLRQGYQARMNTPAVRRDLGEILAHGEPQTGTGQGEATDQAAQPTPTAVEPITHPTAPASNGAGELVTVDFTGLGPSAA